MSYNICVICAIISVIIGIIFIPIALWAIIEVVAFKKSTHQIQYMPLEPMLDSGVNYDVEKGGQFVKDLNKMYNEDLEDL